MTMGTITAQAIVDKAQIVLQDLTAVRWTEAELLGWLNSGQKELATIKPPASVKNAAVQMVAGTKQTAPADAVGAVAVVRNMGAAGTTAGKAVRPIALTTLDALYPDWHTADENEVAEYYMADLGNEKNFYLYPPQPATPTYLELVYPCQPAVIATLAGAIAVDDIYEPAMIDYVVYRALAEETEAGSDARAGTYYQKFALSLGAK